MGLCPKPLFFFEKIKIEVKRYGKEKKLEKTTD
jgi:hypothetical protein